MGSDVAQPEERKHYEKAEERQLATTRRHAYSGGSIHSSLLFRHVYVNPISVPRTYHMPPSGASLDTTNLLLSDGNWIQKLVFTHFTTQRTQNLASLAT